MEQNHVCIVPHTRRDVLKKDGFVRKNKRMSNTCSHIQYTVNMLCALAAAPRESGVALPKELKNVHCET